MAAVVEREGIAAVVVGSIVDGAIVVVVIVVVSHFQEWAVVVVVASPVNPSDCNSRQQAQQRCRHSLCQDLHSCLITVVEIGDIGIVAFGGEIFQKCCVVMGIRCADSMALVRVTWLSSLLCRLQWRQLSVIGIKVIDSMTAFVGR